MNVRVVCISRTIAAGGEVIGQTVAERLGFRYVDEQIIRRAAQHAQVDPQLVAAADYFLHFYQIDKELPTHYDLTINSDVLTPDQAVQVILAAAAGTPHATQNA